MSTLKQRGIAAVDGATRPADMDPNLITYLPIWKTGHRPRFFYDRPVLELLTSCHRTMEIKTVRAFCLQKFGADRTPSKSAIQRYWARLDVAFGPNSSSASNQIEKIQPKTKPQTLSPTPDRGAEPARAGTLPEGASSVTSYQGQSKPIERALRDMGDHAPSGISSGFADLEAAKAQARKARAMHMSADDFATPQGRAASEERPSFWKRMLPWLGDIIGCVSLFALLFIGLWAGEILG